MQSISINNDRESFSGSAQEVIDIMQAPKSAPQKGDIIEYIYHPKQGTSMRFNGTELVSNYPKNVFNMLLRTRISPIPPFTTFKHQLLGLVSADEAKNLLSSVEPTNRRIALAASWVAEPVKVEPIAEPMVAEAVVKPAPEVVATAGALALISAVEKTEVEVQAAAKAAEQAKEEELVLNVAETLTQRHYAPLVVGQIYKSLTYPSRAIDNNQQGTVRIGLVVHRSGELLSVTATQKSDYRLLNQAALKAVKKLLHSQPCPTV